MHRTRRTIVCVLGLASLVLTGSAAAQVTVTINPSQTYQTFRGWGGATPGENVPDLVRSQMLDALVNDLGLSRLRYEGPAGNRSTVRRWEWLNDNADPYDTNWSALNTADLDARVAEWILPFRQRVEARGEPFDLYVSPSYFNGGSSGSAPAWLLFSPAENAEFATSILLRLKNVHGITANYYCILNEAGNDNAWTGAVVVKMIKTLGPTLQALGLSTKIQFPESISADTAWDSYISPYQNDPDIWPYIGCLSYHLYGSNGKRVFIRDLGIAKGIPTAQTEYMGLTVQHLSDDLVNGGVSYWELYGLTGHGNAKINTNRDNTHFSLGSEYWTFRQATHYVRPGDVRIGTTSSLTSFKVLAFTRGGNVTTILLNGLNSTARTANISGQPAGQYGLCQSINGAAYTELGLRTVGADGLISIDVPAYANVTLYPYPGTNQAPTITDWHATPDYLTLPAGTTTLSATATDTELDAISFAWSLLSVPASASVSLTAPNAAGCPVSGLTVAGDYVFRLAVSDATHTVTRDLLLRVHAGNEPPVAVDVHNRIPVQVVLPQTSTSLRGGGWDLENDPLTYKWSVVSQPAGANATIASPTSSSTVLSGLTVAGDYVVRFEVKDPTHTVTQDLTIPVYADPQAPVISTIAASPASPPLGATVGLSGTTSDTPGEIVTHWWNVKTAPAGAKPVFDTPGRATTNVSGLTVQGTYTFTLNALDMSHAAVRDVTVTVGPALPGDFNIDGAVDIVDLLILAETWALSQGDPGFNPACDFDGDGSVDVTDLLTFAEHWPQN